MVCVARDACWDSLLSEVYSSVNVAPQEKPSVQEAVVTVT